MIPGHRLPPGELGRPSVLFLYYPSSMSQYAPQASWSSHIQNISSAARVPACWAWKDLDQQTGQNAEAGNNPTVRRSRSDAWIPSYALEGSEGHRRRDTSSKCKPRHENTTVMTIFVRASFTPSTLSNSSRKYRANMLEFHWRLMCVWAPDCHSICIAKTWPHAHQQDRSEHVPTCPMLNFLPKSYTLNPIFAFESDKWYSHLLLPAFKHQITVEN
jgi:hypothetical protein